MTNQPNAYGEQQAAVPGTQHAPVSGAQPAPRRIMGIQPVLFVGMCLLALVSIITVVLIFIGDFESQAPRVVWTVVVFLAFTGLLALDLVLSRRSATPLVIGVAANTYLLAVLMIAIWVRGTADTAGELGDTGGDAYSDPYYGSSWLFAALLGIVLLTLLVVRAAAAGAWGLISIGKRSGTQFGRVLGLVAAALLGLVGVLLTLHFAIDAFGIDLGEWYWRSTVAAIVIAALAASVTVLLFWNRRNLDWQEAEARGEHVRPAAPANPVVQPVQQGWPQQGWPQQAAAPLPSQSGLLPWPTYPDGTPYPIGPDGQPVFPTGPR